jgi:hypothetical protein
MVELLEGKILVKESHNNGMVLTGDPLRGSPAAHI